MEDNKLWKPQLLQAVRLGWLLFVLLVFGGIANQKHLLIGASTQDVALTLGCVIFAVAPMFLSKGLYQREEEPTI